MWSCGGSIISVSSCKLRSKAMPCSRLGRRSRLLRPLPSALLHALLCLLRRPLRCLLSALRLLRLRAGLRRARHVLPGGEPEGHRPHVPGPAGQGGHPGAAVSHSWYHYLLIHNHVPGPSGQGGHPGAAVGRFCPTHFSLWVLSHFFYTTFTLWQLSQFSCTTLYALPQK